MDETVSEQFESYQKTDSQTLKTVNVPVSCVVETCSVADPDEWWIRNQTRFWSSCKTDHRYFQPDNVYNVNYPWIPNEDEDFGENEMGVGHRTDDVFGCL